MSLFPSLDNIPEDKTYTEIVKDPIGFSVHTEKYFLDVLLQKIKSGQFNETQISHDVLLNYKDYCNYDNFLNPKTRNLYQELWTNENFLRGFYVALQSIKKLDLYFNKSICKIAYDYYLQHMSESDTISILHFNIIRYLNRPQISSISSCMHEASALFIVMASLSSFDRMECIDRVNNLLVKLDYDLSVQDLITIYSALYRLEFKQLFEGTMKKIFSVEELEKNENRKYVNERINQALLTILESMESIEIDKVLIGYSIYNQLDTRPTRFSLKDDQIRINYPRIYSRIIQVEYQGYDII